MPSREENKANWTSFDWSLGGDDWSTGWGSSQMLWFGDGITVQIHANTEHQADALWALQTANAARFGLPDLAAGSDLSALAEVTAGAGS